MKNRIVKLSMSLFFVMAIGLIFSSNAVEASGIEVFIDGKEVNFEDDLEAPYLDSNSRTMIPIRTITEELGHRVDWIQTIKTVVIDNNTYVSISDENTCPFLTSDNKMFIKNLGKTIQMDTEVKLRNSKTYIPARYIVESLGHKLEYENDNGVHKLNILKDKGTMASTTTGASEIYSGHLESVNLTKDEMTFKTQHFIKASDLEIFPELNLIPEHLPNKFALKETDDIMTFKIDNRSKFNIFNIIGENLSKYQFEDAFRNNKMHNKFFYIEVKDGLIKTAVEWYYP